jgi:hypothetical protein
MKYCNVITTVDGSITENLLFKGKEAGEKAERYFIEKAKVNSPSGFQWDDDIENEILDNGYVTFDNVSIFLSWPRI